MDIKHLENILIIAKHGSFSAAAEEIFISIPALSVQAKNLEALFGFKIFTRSNKGLILTQEGKNILPFIEETIATNKKMLSHLGKISSPACPHLRIALNSSLPVYFSDLVIDLVFRAIPNLKVDFSYGETIDNNKKITENLADLAITFGCPQNLKTKTTSILLGEENLVAAYHTSNKNETFIDIGNKVIITPTLNCPFRAIYDEIIKTIRSPFINNRKTTSSDSEILTIHLIKKLNGIGIVSNYNAETHNLNIYPGLKYKIPIFLLLNKDTLDSVTHEKIHTIILEPSTNSNVGQRACGNT